MMQRVIFCLMFAPLMLNFTEGAAGALGGEPMIEFLLQFPMLGVMLYVWNSTRKDHKELMAELIKRLDGIERRMHG